MKDHIAFNNNFLKEIPIYFDFYYVDKDVYTLTIIHVAKEIDYSHFCIIEFDF